MGVVNQKINNIQSDVNHHDQQIGYLKELLENQGEKETEENGNKKCNIRSEGKKLNTKWEQVAAHFFAF